MYPRSWAAMMAAFSGFMAVKSLLDFQSDKLIEKMIFGANPLNPL